MLTLFLLVTVGVLFLFAGAEALVRGASQLALNLGIPSLVVGLTVVSFSTSMPEAVSSLVAQLVKGQGDIALGNVIGSNIANIGLVLGASAIIRPIDVDSKVVWRDSIVMLLVTLLVIGMMYLGPLLQWEGVLLLVLLLAFVTFQYLLAREERRKREKPLELTHKQLFGDIGLVLAGSLGLVVGGYALIEGATGVAREVGISERVIGLTVVALGTSLPELATSMVAAFRRQSDISVGNVVGSNIFNLLLILGIVAVIKPIEFSQILLNVDSLVMLAFSAALWLFVVRDRLVSRREGFALLFGYAFYLALLR